MEETNQKLKNIEYGIDRLVLYIHIANQEDLKPEVREAINDFVTAYLKQNDLTIKELKIREISRIK